MSRILLAMPSPPGHCQVANNGAVQKKNRLFQTDTQCQEQYLVHL